jgi:hypothetical protein
MKSYVIAGIIIFLIIFNWLVPGIINLAGGEPFDYINIFLFINFIALLYIILPDKISLQ